MKLKRIPSPQVFQSIFSWHERKKKHFLIIASPHLFCNSPYTPQHPVYEDWLLITQFWLLILTWQLYICWPALFVALRGGGFSHRRKLSGVLRVSPCNNSLPGKCVGLEPRVNGIHLKDKSPLGGVVDWTSGWTGPFSFIGGCSTICLCKQTVSSMDKPVAVDKSLLCLSSPIDFITFKVPGGCPCLLHVH